MPVYLFLLPVLLFWSCGQSENARQIKNNHAVGLQLTSPPTVNYILIHGGGPNFIVRLDKLKRRLIGSGVKSEDIFMPTYNYKSSVEEIGVELGIKLKKIIDSKPKNTKFDFITHSLGNFAAVYAVATFGLSQSVRKYIGLAGVAHGQSKSPDYCARFKCPPYLYQLAPYNNPLVSDFYAKYIQEISEWDHCAIYSSIDRRVNSPRDSGVIVPGTGYLVEDLSHLELATSQKGFDELNYYCYDGKIGR